jgi:pimeloyl-ACP methyl ester carboxylesterase
VGPGCRVVRRVQAGAGEPAVVLEAGLNNGAASWQRVMPLLAPRLRVAAYDRAGIGGSAPAPGLVTIDRQVDDLASVITGLAAGPCVLAGHSWGGMLVQLLAFRRPDLVAGLVLVDPGTRSWRARVSRALDAPAGSARRGGPAGTPRRRGRHRPQHPRGPARRRGRYDPRGSRPGAGQRQLTRQALRWHEILAAVPAVLRVE